MIDSDFIIKYTNALYSTPVECAPSYNEFRDMFSSGQLASKMWLVKELDNYSTAFSQSDAVIVGAWYGTLGLMLRKKYPTLNISMLDIDERCEKFVHNIIYDTPEIQYITGDMYEYHYKEDLIINTSCEHIPDIAAWTALIPPNKVVVLQSNNFYDGEGHINCVESETELAEKSGLRDIWYSGSLEMPMYTRFMVIGLT